MTNPRNEWNIKDFKKNLILKTFLVIPKNLEEHIWIRTPPPPPPPEMIWVNVQPTVIYGPTINCFMCIFNRKLFLISFKLHF